MAEMKGITCEAVPCFPSTTRIHETPEAENDYSLEEEWAKLNLNRSDSNCKTKGNRNGKSKKKKKNQVLLEGYVEDEDNMSRTKSLTDEDLHELKGCVDLGFGFNYDEIPELRNTLPALELCYSMNQKFLDDHQKLPDHDSSSAESETGSTSASPIPNWKISSPGDDPEDVKARLKFWAQTVACTVRLCN